MIESSNSNTGMQAKERWWDNVWASFIFFTRLPLWRVHQPPRQCYRAVVEHWPLVGWLTGGVAGGVLYGSSLMMPYAVAVVMALVARTLLTGALHEDGLADFFDGFGGGGSDRQRVLAIMKDSHIGTYGVLGLVFYELLLFATLWSMPPLVAAMTIVAADPFAKMITAQLVMMMPYARTEQEAKSRMVYRRMDTWAGISLALQGLPPVAAFIWLTGVNWQVVIIVPCLVMYFLYLFIWRRLRGYTGDCCGAVCLLVELALCLAVCSQNIELPI
ncbi:MAG: adenosylcobinamide-GDP ribazoletransferase [Prevotella sp.]|nr:adenosylcobinamide-GDP ribazoletransferase [Prevotella sp.]